ncbi:MAG TPA: YciI family protein [Puia sp.]|nr:YciI family protein [Puia sp.]
MKEFLLLIRTEGDPWAVLSPEQQQKHVEKAAAYIGNLIKEGKLKGAQPLVAEGSIISNTRGIWTDGPFNESKEVIAGYFLIAAKDFEEAVAIAKANPIYEDQLKARIEVRPVKMVEGINR